MRRVDFIKDVSVTVMDDEYPDDTTTTSVPLTDDSRNTRKRNSKDKVFRPPRALYNEGKVVRLTPVQCRAHHIRALTKAACLAHRLDLADEHIRLNPDDAPKCGMAVNAAGRAGVSTTGIRADLGGRIDHAAW